MARVVNRQGDVLGVVTLEDVLEELVGETRDGAHHDDHQSGGSASRVGGRTDSTRARHEA
jgi:CBS domain containing-hemolysin-like protein